MKIKASVVAEKALKAIKEYAMLEKNSRVIVGLSGGADSVCLLHFLNSIKAEYKLSLVAAHINHGIRGEEAEKDALFSEELAKKLNVEFRLLNVDCVKEANETGEGVEEAGRRIRYEFFSSLANTENSVIATAHNSNDNMETVIFNITRGSALNGAKGIPPKRDNIIRPLIFCTRNEIECYCNENKLNFVTDSTNLSNDYTRNRIRHEIVPVLQSINSSAEDSFSRFSECVRQDAEFLDKLALESLKKAELQKNSFSIDLLNSLDKSIKNRVLLNALKNFSGETPDNKKLGAILNCIENEEKIQLYKNCYAEAKNGVLKLFSEGNTNKKAEKDASIVVEQPVFECSFGDYLLKCETSEKISQKVNDLLLDNFIDCDTIYGNLILRTRKEGDKITLRKRNVTKTLKKLFIEEGVPKEARDTIPVLADDNGVVWVLGFGVNKKNAQTKETKNILRVRVEKNGFTKNE